MAGNLRLLDSTPREKTLSVIRRRAASEILRSLPVSASFNARRELNSRPELAECRSVVLDFAYEEYCRRAEHGSAPDPTEFAASFPEIERSLLRLLEMDELLKADPSLLSGMGVPRWPQVDETFLGFRLIEDLGRGAFSRVFLATEQSLGDRLVVVKVSTSGAFEAEIIGRLQHPKIVPVHSVKVDPATGLTAICMPYISRATMFDVLDMVSVRGNVPRSSGIIIDATKHINGVSIIKRCGEKTDFAEECGSYVEWGLDWARQIAEALAFAHAQNIYHCDIKPSNLLVTNSGGALVIDFNLSFDGEIAKLSHGGTIAYMSPEQLRFISMPEERVPSAVQADLYALGVVLYEVLSGRHPFAPLSSNQPRKAICDQMLNKQRIGAPSLDSVNKFVDPALAAFIENCLTVDHARRPQTASEFAARLAWHCSLPQRISRWIRTHKRRLFVASVGSAVLTAGLGVALVCREPEEVRLLRKGWSQYGHGNYQSAIDCAMHVPAANDNYPDALFLAGRARIRGNNFDIALKDFQRLRPHSTNGVVDACIAYCMSRIAERDKSERDYWVATAWYRSAREKGVTSAPLECDLGICYLRLNDLPKGEDCIRKSLSLDPKHHSAHVQLTLLLRRQALMAANHETAVAAIKESLDSLEEAFNSGPSSAGLLIEAAVTHAIAATVLSTSDPEASARHIENAVSMAGQGLPLGVSSQQLQRLSSYCPAVAESDEFPALLAASSPQGTAIAQTWLSDPLVASSEPVSFR